MTMSNPNHSRLATAILAFALPLCAIGQETSTHGSGLEGLVGTWDLAGQSPYGDLLHILVVSADGTATYQSNGETAPVTDLEIDDNQVRFSMTVFGGPAGSYQLAFAGSFDEEALTGDVLSNGSSFAPVKAPRQADFSGLIGTWELTGTSQFGPLEHRLIVSADGTATYTSGGEVSDVRNLEINGSDVRFEMTVWGGPGSYEVSFVGSFNEEGLEGEMLTSDGQSFAPLRAPRHADI